MSLAHGTTTSKFESDHRHCDTLQLPCHLPPAAAPSFDAKCAQDLRLRARTAQRLRTSEEPHFGGRRRRRYTDCTTRISGALVDGERTEPREQRHSLTSDTAYQADPTSEHRAGCCSRRGTRESHRRSSRLRPGAEPPRSHARARSACPMLGRHRSQRIFQQGSGRVVEQLSGRLTLTRLASSAKERSTMG